MAGGHPPGARPVGRPVQDRPRGRGHQDRALLVRSGKQDLRALPCKHLIFLFVICFHICGERVRKGLAA